MSILNLRVPQQELHRHDILEPPLQRLRAWLGELPLAHPLEAAPQVLQAVHGINRAELAADKRYQAMELLYPTVADLSGILQKQYLNASFPLADNPRQAARAVHQLMTEMANGYKLLVMGFTDSWAMVQRVPPAQLLTAVARAVQHLSLLVLESYLVYEAEPEGVWGDLYQLIRFMERYATHLSPEVQGREDLRSALDVISRTYKRTLLLNLSSPYHLMQGEALDIYRRLERWVDGCRIVPVQPGEYVSKAFFVDLATNEPPRYIPASRKELPAEGQIIDIAQMRVLVGKRIDALTVGHKLRPGAAPLSLPERMERDMLLRLERAWSGRPERQIPRSAQSARVFMATGLNACHYFVGGEQEFDPDLQDVNQIVLESGARPVGKQHETWSLQDKDVWLLSGNIKAAPRPHTEGNVDVWDQVYFIPPELEVPLQETPTGPTYTLSAWQQLNMGQGGLGLACDKGNGVQIKVGELVAYRMESGRQAGWRIGMTRWLKMNPNGSMQVGIMTLARNVAAIAVRAVAGAQEDSKYQRGLLLSNGDTKGRPPTIIVPPFAYDIGTVLRVRHGTKTTHARLTKLLETTKSFSQFHYEFVVRG